MRIHGRPVRMRCRNPRWASSASGASRPTSTAMPASRKPRETAALDTGIGILERRDHAGDPRLRRARPRTAPVTAASGRTARASRRRSRLQAIRWHAASAAASACGLARALVPALADDPPAFAITQPTFGIRRGVSRPRVGERQRARHHGVIFGGEIINWIPVCTGMTNLSRALTIRHLSRTSRIASRKSSTSEKLLYTEAKRM